MRAHQTDVRMCVCVLCINNINVKKDSKLCRMRWLSVVCLMKHATHISFFFVYRNVRATFAFYSPLFVASGVNFNIDLDEFYAKRS